MKRKLFKKVLALLLIISMMATFVGCLPFLEQDGTGDSTVEGEDSDNKKDPVKDDVSESTADYKYVVIVGVDGAGAFFEQASTPNLDFIFLDGAVTFDAITASPSISAHSWGSLFHGVIPQYHQVGFAVDVDRGDSYPVDSAFPSSFRVIREQMPEASLASFCNWNPINVSVIEDNIGVYKDTASNDTAVTQMAINYVTEQVNEGKGAPTFMFVHFDDVDHAGHSYGYGTKKHLESISTADSQILDLYNAYADLGLLQDTLFIVTADHGGIEKTHGGFSDGEKKIMFAALGKTVQKGSTIGEMAIRDTASIVLYALGLQDKQPETWTSRVPSGLFEGVEAVERPVYEITSPERALETVATPEKNSADYISNFIENKNLTTYLTFDGDITDECGGTMSQTGQIFYRDGYFGKAATFGEGYASLNDYSVGKNSYTVSLWLKTNTVCKDPVIFSNKNWNSGKNAGYILSLDDGGKLIFNVGNGSNRSDLKVALPDNYNTGWMHITLVVDREANQVKISLDFGEFAVLTLPSSLSDSSFDSYSVLNIGQDGTGSYDYFADFTIDEFMIFDGALTEEDVSALADYYGKA